MEQASCLGTGQDCSEIAKEIEQRENQIARREYNDRSRCPDNLIEYCDSTMRGCGNKFKRPSDRFYCVHPQDIKIW